MKKELDLEFKLFKDGGQPNRYFNRLSAKQWEYNDMICDMAQIDRLPPFIKYGFDVALANMNSDGDVYRDVPIEYEKGALDGW